MQQLLKTVCLEPVLHDKRNHQNITRQKPALEKSPCSNEDPVQPKINK